VQKLVGLYERGGRGMIRLKLELVNELREEWYRKERFIICSNQKKGNYNQET
jgi:hypothetical protein